MPNMNGSCAEGGLRPLSPTWAKLEILIGLAAAAIGLLCGMRGVQNLAAAEAWPLLAASVLLQTLGGYLALAGHGSHPLSVAEQVSRVPGGTGAAGGRRALETVSRSQFRTWRFRPQQRGDDDLLNAKAQCRKVRKGRRQLSCLFAAWRAWRLGVEMKKSAPEVSEASNTRCCCPNLGGPPPAPPHCFSASGRKRSRNKAAVEGRRT
jgi:hypothetical protein